MKLSKLFSSLIILTLLVASLSCKKDGTSPTMTASINGTSWSGLATGLSTSGTIVISGVTLTTEAIVLTINGTAAGTYQLNPLTLSTQCAVVYKKSGVATPGSSDYYIAQNATIVITSISTDKYATGTFTCTLVHSLADVLNPLTVTSGTFTNIKISGL
jgi:hypothetical protein